MCPCLAANVAGPKQLPKFCGKCITSGGHPNVMAYRNGSPGAE